MQNVRSKLWRPAAKYGKPNLRRKIEKKEGSWFFKICINETRKLFIISKFERWWICEHFQFSCGLALKPSKILKSCLDQHIDKKWTAYWTIFFLTFITWTRFHYVGILEQIYHTHNLQYIIWFISTTLQNTDTLARPQVHTIQND